MMPQTQKIQDFMAELRRQVGGDVRTDLYSRTLYSTDASIYQVMPYGIFFPQHVDDVQAAVELAAKFRVPILPRAGGSSLAGQTVNEALVLDITHHLDQVMEVNQEEHWVRVQPGIILDELNLQLKPRGLQFGPDPASSDRAGLGGIAGNNATGSHSILYGMAADHIIEASVVLSDGSRATFKPVEPAALGQYLVMDGLEGDIYRCLHNLAQNKASIIRTGTPRHWRRCGGYNLDRFAAGIPPTPYPRADGNRFNVSQIICGSEGTLGVITELKLNLVQIPKMTAVAIVHFDELYQALDATQVILQTQPSAVELLDDLSMNLCRQSSNYASLLNTFVQGDPKAVLITEFLGESETELRAKLDQLATHLKKESVDCTEIVPLIKPELQQNAWAVRKAGLGLLMSMRGDYKPIPFIEDSAVPVEHLAEYVTSIENFCRGLGSKVAYYAHASGGCLHIRPLINTKIASDLEKLTQISQFACQQIGKYGGTWSSEHGDGRARSWMNERFFGQELFALFREVKQTFDPHNIFNPGNVVDGGPPTENLRFGPAYQHIGLKEKLDFSSDQGYHRAIEMCNGAGVCRKRTGGTMCPSYMVTREEEHSTRGRANMLRAALTGKIPAQEFTSRRMYEVMDLCISCKACKTECPSAVDMAKIKFEYLAHYYEQHGTPLRARLFGHINFFSRINSGFRAPMVNFLTNLSWAKRGFEKFLGISRRRRLPEFAAEPFTRWFERRTHTPESAAREGEQFSKPKVVLFNDTFNTFNDPHIAIAATEVLEEAGFEVVLPGHRCCGRPMISKGLVEAARQAAQETVAKLAPFAEQGIPIVGLEPSCLLSMRDEYHYLLPHDKRVGLIADHCHTFEEFVATLADEGKLKLKFKAEKRKVLLHGHCQQKALVGTGPSKRMLSLPGYEVEEVDSGCCGMAGSFGYEAEHYDISMAMGERRLFPAVRQQGQDTIIAAAGTSCREQIMAGTGRQAKHPAEILREALI